ncbi:SDR family NAD(P)-dependent oxidoreductase [Kribbella italica]|uniref:NAD(P)-dependent dehydrogenase (Short-subunit alcohol dehydrogenase family) n=1 Tax=Kribbella italica TaxID=1540520 RepID=A0A7W9MZE3_9ACTN|nr:SDR family NAD(P)-dependent oxidoreductase [Kribbella italica]MBB5841307.1 NAD(P)-dependent dehydrogenase (short-subunit alcohol dehydrogenase family) [Kribbella italica]
MTGRGGFVRRPSWDLAGKRALVTGAAGAFGRATVEALRGRGATVVGLDLQKSDDVIECDLTQPELIPAAVGRLGGLDLLINNAGIGVPALAGDAPDATARKVIEVNLFAGWGVTAAALPALREAKGRVIFVSSGLAYVTLPLAASYLVSKRAIDTYADALRIENGRHLDVSVIYPGYVPTPIHDASLARGVDLGMFLPAETVEQVVGTIVDVAAARRPPRNRASTRTTGIGVAVARHLPSVADRIVRVRTNRRRRGLGELTDRLGKI